jgi:hypothetical protein
MSGWNSERTRDETLLSDHIAFFEPADLTFTDNVHRLVSRNRTQCAVRRTEPLTGQHALLHKTMVLLNDVVQVRRWSALAPPAEFAVLLQFCDRGGISRVTGNIDDPGTCLSRTQSKPEKAFGRNQVAVRRQQEVDSVSG